MGRARKLRLSLVAIAVGIGCGRAHAQIATDGTLGTATSLLGPNYAITSGLGRQVGSNLFHSFSSFNLATGQSATFSGPAGIANVISRVTGASASAIDGLIRSTIPGANLFLVNPMGILFGPNASLDLTGSFYASTANHIRLADGGRFDATTPEASVLTTAPPAAFGFLGPTAAAITVQGSTLAVPEGKSLGLIGGTVTVSDATLRTIGGNLVIAGMGAIGEVSPIGAGAQSAPISVERSLLETQSGTDSAPGRIVIRGGQVLMVDSNLTSTNRGAANAAPVELIASADLTVGGSNIVTTAEGAGRGADLVFSGMNVTLRDNAYAYTQTFGAGAGGAVDLRAERALDIIPSGFTSVYAYSFGPGNAGAITATADTVLVQTGNIASEVSGSGSAGPIRIRGRRIDVRDGGWVYSRSYAAGEGADIDIAATASVEASGLYYGDSAQLWTQSWASGRGGNIRIEAPSIRFADGRAVATVGHGTAQGGHVTIKGDSIVATDGTEITAHASTGPGGNLTIEARELFIGPGTSVNTFALDTAPAGDLIVRSGNTTIMGGVLGVYTYGSGASGNLRLSGEKLYVGGTPGALSDGSILTYVGYEALGKGGSITIDVPSIVFGPYSKLWSVTNGAGNGGSVLIRTHDMEAKAGTAIFTDTAPWASGGNGGNLTIEGTGRLLMGTDPVPPFAHWILGGEAAGIGAFSAGGGRTGDVIISFPEIIGYNKSNFVAFGKGWGDAGSITINAQRMSLYDKSSIHIWAANEYSGRRPNNAGSILLNIGESFQMSSGQENYREVQFGQDLVHRGGIFMQSMTDGNAGSLIINAPRIVLDDATVEASTWFGGRGGRIELHTDALVMRNGARIDTKAMPESTGAAGAILIDARERIELSGISRVDGSFAGISAQTWGSGDGGDVRIRTGNLTIDRGYIKSSTGGTGQAGGIDIEARRVALTSGAAIDAGTAPGSGGTGGNVRVSAAESILVSGIDRSAFVEIPEQPVRTGAWAEALGPGRPQGPAASTISSNTAGSGTGGNLNLSAPRITIEDGGRISAGSSGSGTAGSIFITAPDWLKLDHGSITTQALASDGGNIDIRAGNMVRLEHSEISTSVGSGEGRGGNIFIDPLFVILESSRIAANAFGGAGGNISVIANVFLTSPDSVLDASSQLGVPGSVQISAPRTDAIAGMPALPAQFFDASGLLREACGGRWQPGSSRLVGLGRGGTTASLTGYVASRYFEDGTGPLAQPGDGTDQNANVAALPPRLLAGVCAIPR